MSNKICKHYVKGTCNKNDCTFTHIDNICQYHFFGKCKNNNCSKNHDHKLITSGQKLIKKNTESFEPYYDDTDMRVNVSIYSLQNPKYDNTYSPNDVVLVPNLFTDIDNIYEKLLDEMQKTGINDEKLWKLWHGNSHMIADDHLNWKNKCPTFMLVIDRLTKYFNMDVKATRFNYYRDSKDFKPLHHDAAAVDPNKAKIQNFTVGVSFGSIRTAMFEHAKTRTKVSFPLTNGSTYCFSSQINVDWRHGIPSLKLSENEIDNGRISIIAWSWISMN
jgi:hypothetical protein